MATVNPNINSLAVVIDFGSQYLKCGLETDQIRPAGCFPAMIGRPNAPGCMPKGFYVGNECKELPFLVRRHPVTDAEMGRFHDAKNLIHHSMYEVLGVIPEEHPLMVTESPDRPRQQREKLLELIFETFHVPSYCAVDTPKLAVLAQGKETGIALEIGGDSSTAAAVYEGHTILSSVQRSRFAGNALTCCFIAQMLTRGVELTNKSGRDKVNEMKFQWCYVASDYDEEMTAHEATSQADVEHALPDGETLTIGIERFRTPEALFNHSITNHTSPFCDLEEYPEKSGIQDLVGDCINASDVELRAHLAQNVVYAGGCAMFPGFDRRLQIEMQKVENLPPVRLSGNPDRSLRMFSVYQGGVVLSSLDSSKRGLFVSEEEYRETGEEIVLRKCF